MSSGAIAVYLVAAALVVVAQDHYAAATVVFAVLTAATVAIAWRTDAAAGALPVAAALAALVVIAWAVDPVTSHLVASGPGGGPEPSSASIAWHFVLGMLFAVLFAGSGYLIQGRREHATVPRPVGGDGRAGAVRDPGRALLPHRRSRPLDPVCRACAAARRVVRGRRRAVDQRPARPGVASAAALHAAGAAAALALTLTFALEKGWLTVGLALMAPGIAWVAEKRPLPLLRWLAAAAAVLVLARIVWEPRIAGDDLGTTPIFNWLLYGYGVPALVVLDRRPSAAPARRRRCRRASSRRRRSCSPCCWCSSRSATP